MTFPISEKSSLVIETSLKKFLEGITRQGAVGRGRELFAREGRGLYGTSLRGGSCKRRVLVFTIRHQSKGGWCHGMIELVYKWHFEVVDGTNVGNVYSS
jgi:hypothetical protein